MIPYIVVAVFVFGVVSTPRLIIAICVVPILLALIVVAAKITFLIIARFVVPILLALMVFAAKLNLLIIARFVVPIDLARIVFAAKLTLVAISCFVLVVLFLIVWKKVEQERVREAVQNALRITAVERERLRIEREREPECQRQAEVTCPAEPATVDEDVGGDCAVCFDRAADTLLMPCKHLAVCGMCWVQMDRVKSGPGGVRCPFCRGAVVNKITVFRN